MRCGGLQQPLSWQRAAAVVMFLCIATVAHADYEKTCTREDRLRPRGVCGQQLTVLIAGICRSRYNKRNAAGTTEFYFNYIEFSGRYRPKKNPYFLTQLRQKLYLLKGKAYIFSVLQCHITKLPVYGQFQDQMSGVCVIPLPDDTPAATTVGKGRILRCKNTRYRYYSVSDFNRFRDRLAIPRDCFYYVSKVLTIGGRREEGARTIVIQPKCRPRRFLKFDVWSIVVA